MKKVKLPYEGKHILQDMDGHGITSDTQFLVNTVLLYECTDKINTGGGSACYISSLTTKLFGNISLFQTVSNNLVVRLGVVSKGSACCGKRIKTSDIPKETEKGSEAGSPVRVLEIGTGNGIIAIMLALSGFEFDITAVEVQIPLYLLACRNIKETEVKVDLRLADIRKHNFFPDSEKYRIIVSNPPYYRIGTGKVSKTLSKNISRFELLCDMNDIFACIGNHLDPEGNAYILYPVSREKEIRLKAEKYQLHIKAIHHVPTDRNLPASKGKKVYVFGVKRDAK